MKTPVLLHDLPLQTADRFPDRTALRHRGTGTTYAELALLIERFAAGLQGLGLGRLDRVGIYLPKQLEAVAAFFGTSKAGGVFVPINPLLKAEQVVYILRNCSVRILVTSRDRWAEVRAQLGDESPVTHVVLVDGATTAAGDAVAWQDLVSAGRCARDFAPARHRHRHGVDSLHVGIDRQAEGRGALAPNMLTGAVSVSTYLENTRGRPLAGRAAVQLRLRPEPADDGISRRRQRRAARLPVSARRRAHGRVRADHRSRGRAARVDPGGRPRVARDRHANTCATSPIPAGACRVQRSTSCASRCRRRSRS